MELLGHVFQVLGKIMIWVWLAVAVIVAVFVVYMYFIKDWVDYRRAKIEIVSYIKMYKRRCTGNNRFIVTIETLQNAFREYDTLVIEKVWLELVHEKLIEQDIQDNTWCVR